MFFDHNRILPNLKIVLIFFKDRKFSDISCGKIKACHPSSIFEICLNILDLKKILLDNDKVVSLDRCTWG